MIWVVDFPLKAAASSSFLSRVNCSITYYAPPERVFRWNPFWDPRLSKVGSSSSSSAAYSGILFDSFNWCKPMILLPLVEDYTSFTDENGDCFIKELLLMLAYYCSFSYSCFCLILVLTFSITFYCSLSYCFRKFFLLYLRKESSSLAHIFTM